MNEPNYKRPKERDHWWATRGSQIFGAAVGAALTLGIQVIVRTFDMGDTTLGWLMMAPLWFSLLPAVALSKLVGVEWSSQPYGGAWALVGLAVVSNALLSAAVTMCIARLFRRM